MSREIAESDWKVFRELHPIALERYCQRAADEIERLVLQKDKPARDRFGDAIELVNRRRKELANLFDDFRRSTALWASPRTVGAP